MSNESAYKKLFNHGKVICDICKKIIIQCRCMECGDNIKYDICDDCEKKQRILDDTIENKNDEDDSDE